MAGAAEGIGLEKRRRDVPRGVIETSEDGLLRKLDVAEGEPDEIRTEPWRETLEMTE